MRGSMRQGQGTWGGVLHFTKRFEEYGLSEWRLVGSDKAGLGVGKWTINNSRLAFDPC